MTYLSRSPMQFTFHTGPEKNRYCKIRTNRGEFKYRVDGIPEGSRDTPKKRRDLLLQFLTQNYKVQHTHVIKVVQELSGLAKKTIENELDRMEEEKILESEKEDERPNSLRRWSIRSPKSKIEANARKDVKTIIDSSENYVSKIEKSYEKFNSAQKAWAMTYLLQALHNFQPLVEVICQEYGIKRDKKKFDIILNRAYKILRSEKRDYVDGRPILRRLLHLGSSGPYMEMNNFLKEIKNN